MRTDQTSRKGRSAVLELVKRSGPVTSERLAEMLGITGMAVRQHLAALEAEDLVRHETRSGHRGRPAKLWSITDAAQSRFPDTHAALTVELIRNTRKALGGDALGAVLAARTDEQRLRYGSELAGRSDLGDRLELLARIRSREGYMAKLEKDGEDWVLIENHCPICDAVKICNRLCREELALFATVLGTGVSIARESHIAAGDGRCTYRISEAAP